MFYNQNFYDRLDKYNYINNNYNQPMFTENIDSSKIYDPYQGFIRGNMFPNLYNGYGFDTLDIVPLNDQAKMLTTMDALCFAAHDINLYLDIYPNDKDMISLYNSYIKQEEQIKNEYQRKYGPITVDYESKTWLWNNGPWPWENKEDK